MDQQQGIADYGGRYHVPTRSAHSYTPLAPRHARVLVRCYNELVAHRDAPVPSLVGMGPCEAASDGTRGLSARGASYYREMVNLACRRAAVELWGPALCLDESSTEELVRCSDFGSSGDGQHRTCKSPLCHHCHHRRLEKCFRGCAERWVGAATYMRSEVDLRDNMEGWDGVGMWRALSELHSCARSRCGALRGCSSFGFVCRGGVPRFTRTTVIMSTNKHMADGVAIEMEKLLSRYVGSGETGVCTTPDDMSAELFMSSPLALACADGSGELSGRSQHAVATLYGPGGDLYGRKAFAFFGDTRR